MTDGDVNRALDWLLANPMQAAVVGLSARPPSSDVLGHRDFFEGEEGPATPFSPDPDDRTPRLSVRQFSDFELPCDPVTFERAMSETVDVYIG
jgi:hypothetical protein